MPIYIQLFLHWHTQVHTCNHNHTQTQKYQSLELTM